MLAFGLLLASALGPTLQLREAQARYASAARAAFARTASPEVARRPWDLAVLIAAEERHSQSPEAIRAEVDAQLDRLAEAADARLKFARLLPGGAAAASKARPSAQVVATAVSTTLFGARGALDNADVEGFFRGNSVKYYDPRNSYADCVFERRQGIPITLSLVHLEVSRRLGLTLVGLNAPSHLLLASPPPPAPPRASSAAPLISSPTAEFSGLLRKGDLAPPPPPFFSLHCFDAGVPMSADETCGFLRERSGGPAGLEGGPEPGDAFWWRRLDALRARPMSAHAWAARLLRNLCAVHAAGGDAVRLLGASERLRVLGAAAPEASSEAEMAEAAVRVAACLCALRWEERRDQARGLLRMLLETQGGGLGAPEGGRGGASAIVQGAAGKQDAGVPEGGGRRQGDLEGGAVLLTEEGEVAVQRLLDDPWFALG